MKLEAGDATELVESLAVDALVSGKVNQPSSIDKDVDAVTLDAVNKVHFTSFIVLCCPVRNVVSSHRSSVSVV